MNRVCSTFGRMMLVALLVVLAVATIAPTPAYATKANNKVVRVGWYESSYNTVDKFGRRSGYAYEYQLKIASYTGWSYEYVNGSWSELLQMLLGGKIDLMSDVSYTDERATHMLFPDYPMGAEDYYLFVDPDNQEISSTDASTLNGKRVGVNKDSVQADFYREWARRNGVEAELVEVVTSEDESLQMLEDHKLDAYVTVDSFVNPERAMPVYKVGSSDYFFAVSNKRPDLLVDLNAALAKINDEDRYYNQQMFERYIKTSGANAFLTADELDWVSAHGKIRVGYEDNYLAFCDADPKTGKLTGALSDFLDYASGCLENAELSFEPVAYPTAEAALAALKKNEVDCVFPVCLSGYDGEKHGVAITPPLMSTDVYAVVRQDDMDNFINREHVVVAVNHGNLNYDAFLVDHFPKWQTVYYKNTEECLKAVSESVADCVLISSYRYNNISRFCERHNLTTLPTAEGLDSCFAVRKGCVELYSVLAKAVGQIPSSTVNSALSFYITQDAKLTTSDFVYANITVIIGCACAVVLVCALMLWRSIRAQKRAKELIAATEVDALTGLYNREYFYQYANEMRRKHPHTPLDAIVINVDRFHSVNTLNGKAFGDQVLRVLGNEVRILAQQAEGIAGRCGADRFDILCSTEDDYKSIYDRLQGKLEVLAPSAGIRLRMGVLPKQADLDPHSMFNMAQTACSMVRGNRQDQEHLVVFDEQAQAQEQLEQRLLNDLQRALGGYEFEVHYQPVFDIQGDSPRLVSAEALVRWEHPELGTIMPADFVPLLERHGKINEVDKCVWDQVARQVVRWHMQFGVTIPVSVNLSRADVFDPMLENTLDGILLGNGLKPDAIRLEVTESAFAEDANRMILVVDNLRKKGYMVAMDDFGIGNSSLYMLSGMPIDGLKMDGAFIRNIEDDDRARKLVNLILGMARSLGVEAIAEGVETEPQLQLLKRLGCTLVQGFYLSRPLHPSDFEAEYLKGMGW